MKQNKYDDDTFFARYSEMERSQKGLAGAGEWHAFHKLFPKLSGKRVLDLGCGFGWHCAWAAAEGAAAVVGTDISEKMLQRAGEINSHPAITYQRTAIEDIAFADASFDVVLSSLAFHYIQSFDAVADTAVRLLAEGGHFVFSVEHPVFTAEGRQDWIYSVEGEPLYWPVDRYFLEGRRDAVFLGEEVIKYHRTVGSYINALLQRGLTLTGIAEPQPDPALLAEHPEYKNELRRPMFLLLAAQK